MAPNSHFRRLYVQQAVSHRPRRKNPRTFVSSSADIFSSKVLYWTRERKAIRYNCGLYKKKKSLEWESETKFLKEGILINSAKI